MIIKSSPITNRLTVVVVMLAIFILQLLPDIMSKTLQVRRIPRHKLLGVRGGSRFQEGIFHGKKYTTAGGFMWCSPHWLPWGGTFTGTVTGFYQAKTQPKRYMVHAVYDDKDEEDWEIVTEAGVPSESEQVVPMDPPINFNIACYSLTNDKEFVSISEHAPTPDRHLIVDAARHPGITFFASLSRVDTRKVNPVLVSGIPECATLLSLGTCVDAG